MTSKLCQRCKINKSISDFYKHKQTKDGYETTCKNCIKIRSAEWAKNNPEKNNQKDKRYVERNLEKRRETNKKYYESNKEAIRERVKKSMSKNPELYAELGRKHANRRRARKLDNGFESYTEAQVLEAYGLLCHLCLLEINLGAPRKVGALGWEFGLQIDHVVPLSKGGPDTLDNVRPAHGLCNMKKSNLIE